MAIRRVAIAGLGTMGPGMAARIARAGLGVSVHDVAKDAVDRAPQAVALAQSVLDRLGVRRRHRATVRSAIVIHSPTRSPTPIW